MTGTAALTAPPLLAAPTTPAAPVVPAAPADPAAAATGPQVLRWDGQPQGWWSRNGLSLGIGAGVGVAAGLGAAMFTTSLGRSMPQALGIAAAAAFGVGAATFGLTSLIRSRSDRVPDPPTGPSPVLPGSTPLAPVHGGEVPRGLHVARGDGSYLESVPVTKYRTGADGKLESYTDYELQRRYFDWSVSTEAQVGRREGYATMQEALEDVPVGDSVAIRRQSDRLVAYDMQSRSHWGDLDDLVVYDQATEAIVSPGGRIWVRDQLDPEFHAAGTVDRVDPTGIHGEAIGEHELRYRSNPEVHVGTIYSGRFGHEDLPGALGEALARPGDQAVLLAGGRYHVADAYGDAPDRTVPNDGFVTTRHADRVVAVEQQGGVWSPNGDWYVAPREG